MHADAPEGFLHHENLLKGQTDLCVRVCVCGMGGGGACACLLFYNNKGRKGLRPGFIDYFSFFNFFTRILGPPYRKSSNPAAH